MNYCKIYFHCQGGNVVNHRNCHFYKKDHPRCACKYWTIPDEYCNNDEAIKYMINDLIDSISHNRQIYINDNMAFIMSDKSDEDENDRR